MATIQVNYKNHSNNPVTINEEDFDASFMSKIGEKEAPKTEVKKPQTTASGTKKRV